MDQRPTERRALTLSALSALTLYLVGEGYDAPHLVAGALTQYTKEKPDALKFRVYRTFVALTRDGLLRRVDHRAYVVTINLKHEKNKDAPAVP